MKNNLNKRHKKTSNFGKTWPRFYQHPMYKNKKTDNLNLNCFRI